MRKRYIATATNTDNFSHVKIIVMDGESREIIFEASAAKMLYADIKEMLSENYKGEIAFDEKFTPFMPQ